MILFVFLSVEFLRSDQARLDLVLAGQVLRFLKAGSHRLSPSIQRVSLSKIPLIHSEIDPILIIYLFIITGLLLRSTPLVVLGHISLTLRFFLASSTTTHRRCLNRKLHSFPIEGIEEE